MKTSSLHLSSTQVADLLDERLDPGDRESVITHLAACAECRHEVADLHGALSHVNERQSRSRWFSGVALAAAAVVAFVAIPRFTTRPATHIGNPTATRTAEPSPSESAARIGIVQPSDGGTISAAVFTWKSAGADASYSFTVQDTAGAVLWTKTVTDTSAALPATVKLVRGARYFWSVDARLADGSTSRSGAHSFTAP